MRNVKRAKPKPNPHYEALLWIAQLSSGIPMAHIDWSNIGKRAVERARAAIAGKCEKCGTAKPYIGRTR